MARYQNSSIIRSSTTSEASLCLSLINNHKLCAHCTSRDKSSGGLQKGILRSSGKCGAYGGTAAATREWKFLCISQEAWVPSLSFAYDGVQLPIPFLGLSFAVSMMECGYGLHQQV
eukprot:3116576-Amphidinium_carterae.1